MVFWENFFSHIRDHVVPVDVPAVTNRSAIEPGMEISFAHKYGKPAAGNVDGDTGVAFLSGEL